MKEAATIADAFVTAAMLYPDKEAIVYQSRRLTYKDAYAQVCRLSNLLIANGASVGSKIGIQLPRSPEYILAYFAAAMAGAVIVPLGPNLTPREAYSVLNYCDVQMLISSAEQLDHLDDIALGCQQLQAVFIIEERDPNELADQSRTVVSSPATLKCILIDERLDSIPEIPPNIMLDPDSLALLLHTSGTTSAPKRVMLSHRNVLASARSHIASLNLGHEDKVLIALPMFFGYCNTAQLVTHILLGGTLVLMDSTFTPSKFCRIVQAERITTFTGVPTMLLYLLAFRHFHNYDLSSLRYICFGGSTMPYERIAQLAELLPTVGFVQTYGQTEASPRVTALLPDDIHRKCGSVGKAIPGVQVSICDESGARLPPLQVGEVVVCGENVMLGYYKRPEVTQEVLRQGYLYTGDMGYLDDEEYLYLVGRRKNIIIRGGMNIYPEEIEEYLLEHPAVAEAVVVGEAHPLQGEAPVALIVLRADATMSAEEIIAYCKAGLMSYKIPMRVEFRTELPKTYNQKIQRHALVAKQDKQHD